MESHGLFLINRLAIGLLIMPPTVMAAEYKENVTDLEAAISETPKHGRRVTPVGRKVLTAELPQ